MSEPQHYVDAEVGHLVNLLQERMECGIVAMIVMRPGGLKIAMPVDGHDNELIWDWLENADWHGMRSRAPA